MPAEDIARIDDLIVAVRGQRAILAADLAGIYGVETRVLNQAVKRNLEKFPADFMFQLTPEEAEAVQRSRSQIVILNGHSRSATPPKTSAALHRLPRRGGAAGLSEAAAAPRVIAVMGG